MGRYHRWALLYLASYLCGGGLGFLLFPQLTLRMMLSNGNYGEVLPRVLGAMVLALGVLVTQILRHQIMQLYGALIVVRIGLCTIWVVLYSLYRDPLFLVLLAMVGLGVVLAVVAGRLEPTAGSRAP